jgi:pimeloyl-ACP methyl ester carboxylesterase
MLVASLSEKYHAVAVDLYGYGKSPDWPRGNDVRLGDEINLIAPILSKAGRFHLVGHSYGAHISIKIAIDNPDRVASLTLYEPTAFYLLEPGTAARLEIEAIRDETKRFLDRDEDERAAEHFVEYWVGPGAWRATPEQVRPGIIKGMRKVRFEWNGSFAPDYSPQQIRALSMPMLLLTGSRTTSAARGVIAALRTMLPAAGFAEIAEVGHMGPVTNPGVVNPAILAFIDKHVG